MLRVGHRVLELIEGHRREVPGLRGPVVCVVYHPTEPRKGPTLVFEISVSGLLLRFWTRPVAC